ncbi:hypothetical protein [Sulfurimonas sp.]
MKIITIILSVTLIGAFTMGMADEAASTDTTSSVDAQIEAIQAAPAQERVELMNEFKQRLMQMNQEDRMLAIQEMQSKMQASAPQSSEAMSGDMTHARAQEHVQEMQMQTNEQMNTMQNMTQQQAGSQFMQTTGAGTSLNIPAGGAPSMNTNFMQRR